MSYTINQDQLNILSYALEQVGTQSQFLEEAAHALINFRETEPSIVRANVGVFARSLSLQAELLEDLAELIEGVHNDVIGYDVEAARKALYEGLNDE